MMADADLPLRLRGHPAYHPREGESKLSTVRDGWRHRDFPPALPEARLSAGSGPAFFAFWWGLCAWSIRAYEL
jgi:hypothetical protein